MELPPPPPPMFGYGPLAKSPGSRHSALSISGGIAALVAAIITAVACFLPYAHYSASDGGPTAPSIFNGGFAGSWGYALEPLIVVMVAIVGGVMLLAPIGRMVRALASGVLLAIGLQTVALFIGYAIAAIVGSQLGEGSIVGMVGGVILLAAGAMGAASLLSPEPGPGR